MTRCVCATSAACAAKQAHQNPRPASSLLAAAMFKTKLPPSKAPPSKLPTANQLAQACSSSASSTTQPRPTAPPPHTLSPHAVSFPFAAAPSSVYEAVSNAGNFSEICDAAVLVRARCHTPLPGRSGGGLGVCYCGQQDDDGVPHGRGLLLLADGCFYYGSFLHGQRHGTGVAVFAETSASEGALAVGGLPSLSNIGHAVYDTPRPHVIAQALGESEPQSSAGRALQQLKALRVTLDDLAAGSSRHARAFRVTAL